MTPRPRNSEAEMAEANRVAMEADEEYRQRRTGGLTSDEREAALAEQRRILAEESTLASSGPRCDKREAAAETAASRDDEEGDNDDEDEDEDEDGAEDSGDDSEAAVGHSRPTGRDRGPRPPPLPSGPEHGQPEQMSEAKKQRLARAKKFEQETAERVRRLEEKIYPAIERVKTAAKAKGCPEVFVDDFDHDSRRAVVVVKGLDGEYKSLGSVIGGQHEEDVKLVFGSTIAADLGSKEVTIPRNLTKRDLPFVAREILRLAYLDRQEPYTKTEKVGRKGQKKEVTFTDYRETSEGGLFDQERKREAAYRRKLIETRENWKTRPFITARNEYKEAEAKYLGAKQNSEILLDKLLVVADNRFVAETGLGLFDGWGGPDGFEGEKKRRLAERQNEFVYKFDTAGQGFLTGFYTPDKPAARDLTGWDYVPLLSFGRRLWYDENPFDQLRRAKRILWDNSETGANARFRHKVLHDFEDQEGWSRAWRRARWFTGEDAPLALTGTAAAVVGGAIVTGLAWPYRLFERVNEMLDDKVEDSFNWLFKETGWKWLQTKSSWKAKREKQKKWLEDRVDSLLKIRSK